MVQAKVSETDSVMEMYESFLSDGLVSLCPVNPYHFLM